jgi:hypothetical protein
MQYVLYMFVHAGHNQLQVLQFLEDLKDKVAVKAQQELDVLRSLKVRTITLDCT